MISVKELEVKLDNRVILSNLNLEIGDGEKCVILGPSGEGKSVLIKTIVGLIKPSKGSVIIDGVDMHKGPKEERRRVKANIGFLFQGAALFDFLSVHDNVKLPLTIGKDYDREEVDQKVKEALEIVGLEKEGEKMPDELSGGMQKRVAFARALIKRPKYLFCDEPNSGLDPLRARNIDEVIYKLQNSLGATSIIVTHDMESIKKVAERVIFVENKSIVFDGQVSDIKGNDQSHISSFINSYSTS